MKKSILLGASLLGAALVLSSCDKKESKKSYTLETFSVDIYDIDGEKLSSYDLLSNESKSLVEKLQAENANVISEQTNWGTSITSIDGSIVDSNYYLAFYVNGELSQVGIDLYEPKENDKVEFKVECWKEFDETDKLVDKVVYQYIKNYLGLDFTYDTNFDNYFAYIDYNLMEDVAKNYVTLNSDLDSYLDTYDLSTLEGKAFGKYFYTGRAYDKDFGDFKGIYRGYLDSLTDLGQYPEYNIPFIVSPAKTFNFDSEILDLVLRADYAPNTEYGYDGANWWYTTQLLLGNYTNETYLTTISQEEYTNPTSLSLSIGSFAASNVNPRDSKYEKDGKDLIETLLESYDENLGLIKYAQEDTGIVFSTNQIYLGLITYKLQRDSGKAVNYFA